MAKYFTVEELCRSEVASRAKINNTSPPEVTGALTALIENLLDPVRERWAAPITVNSGYRCPQLNRAVGGAATSGHLRGEAADITVGSPAENRRLFELIVDSGLPFDQLIDECDYRWLHLSYRQAGNRRQILHL
jgi:D-alanyl-D-alanine dipeptidase